MKKTYWYFFSQVICNCSDRTREINAQNFAESDDSFFPFIEVEKRLSSLADSFGFSHENRNIFIVNHFEISEQNFKLIGRANVSMREYPRS